MKSVRRHLWSAWVRGVLLLLVVGVVSAGNVSAEPILSDVPASGASVRYDFHFTQLRANANTGSNANLSFPNFSLRLTLPSYVAKTGSWKTATRLSTPLGYNVGYVYTARMGWWGFSPDAGASIGDTYYTFDGASFLFTPSAIPTPYVTEPGAYQGSVVGNAPYTEGGPAYAIGGVGTLVVTENPAPVPEPTSILLVGSGATLLIARYRRKRRS